ncbi:hypothetical protein IFM89_008573 [Coptis chinensis]|uniref:U-box domain-containing protein n=1 Tax=Coptis chinensis TaxID=261450 RepID=A0A835LU56_9MAGN|nr:hypothetical protein IFM89_008573 [Coptis chinensis]
MYVEEALGEIPDEFLDPIQFTLTKDPVILPSSNVTVDRPVIQRHLLKQCTTCKIFGHSDAKCHKNKAKAVEIQPTQAFKPAKPHQKTQQQRTASEPIEERREIGQRQEVEERPLEPVEEILTESQIVVHEEVRAANRFEDIEVHQDDTFEEVRTDFDPQEMVPYIIEGEDDLPEEELEERNTFSIKRGQFQQEQGYSASEEEFEKEYFLDHIPGTDEEQETLMAGMIATPPVKGSCVETKKLSELTGLNIGNQKAKKKRTKGKPKGAGKNHS